ncbi:hypothetical protein K3495_g10297 [Podosphaera aphanis]|nr:hypothetical protein K3495_g10297 [Podosphaera aphanis]
MGPLHCPTKIGQKCQIRRTEKGPRTELPSESTGKKKNDPDSIKKIAKKQKPSSRKKRSKTSKDPTTSREIGGNIVPEHVTSNSSQMSYDMFSAPVINDSTMSFDMVPEPVTSNFSQTSFDMASLNVTNLDVVSEATPAHPCNFGSAFSPLLVTPPVQSRPNQTYVMFPWGNLTLPSGTDAASIGSIFY